MADQRDPFVTFDSIIGKRAVDIDTARTFRAAQGAFHGPVPWSTPITRMATGLTVRSPILKAFKGLTPEKILGIDPDVLAGVQGKFSVSDFVGVTAPGSSPFLGKEFAALRAEILGVSAMPGLFNQMTGLDKGLIGQMAGFDAGIVGAIAQASAGATGLEVKPHHFKAVVSAFDAVGDDSTFDDVVRELVDEPELQDLLEEQQAAIVEADEDGFFAELGERDLQLVAAFAFVLVVLHVLVWRWEHPQVAELMDDVRDAFGWTALGVVGLDWVRLRTKR